MPITLEGYADPRDLVGIHPNAYPGRTPYGRERHLPSVNGSDNSVPFANDPLEIARRIVNRKPLPSCKPQKKLAPAAIIEDVLGMPAKDHAEMVMKGKASRELYRD